MEAVLTASSRPKDRHRVLDADAERAAAALVAALADRPETSPESFEARILLGRLYERRYHAVSSRRQAREVKSAVRVLLPVFLGRSDALEVIPVEFQPALATAVQDAAKASVDRARESPGVEALDEAIGLFRRILAASDPTGWEHGVIMGNLGVVLYFRFERTDDPADLDAAIEATNTAVDVARIRPWDQVSCLRRLKLMLYERYKRSDAPADIEAVVAAIRARLALTARRIPHDDDPSDLPAALTLLFARTGADSALQESLQLVRDRDDRLEMAADAWVQRVKRTDATDDQGRAIEALRQAVGGLPSDHPEQGEYQLTLGVYLADQFDRTGVPGLEDEAIQVLRAVVARPGLDDDRRTMAQAGVTELMLVRYRRTGVMENLDVAVQASRDAVSAVTDDAGRLIIHTNLATALSARFNESDTAEDLAEAMSSLHTALELAGPDSPDRTLVLVNLAGVYAVRFERAGQDEDLDQAHSIIRAAMAATMLGEPDRPRRLSILASVLIARYERDGTLAELDEAIDALRAALDATPDPSPDRPGYVSRLSIALRYRYERLGAMADLDEAVETGRDAVTATLYTHPDYARRGANYAATLHRRFLRTRNSTDLDAAIFAARASVNATPPAHPDLGRRLGNLSHYLITRVALAQAVQDAMQDQAVPDQAVQDQDPPVQDPQNLADLDDAVDAARTSVDITPAVHRRRAMYLLGLGTALAARARAIASSTDLDECVEVERAAVQCALDHQVRAQALVNLGKSLKSRFEWRGAREDRLEALAVWTAALEVPGASPSERIEAARLAADLGGAEDAHAMADLLHSAVGLLPDLAPRRLARADQQFALGEVAGLAADAAALTLSDLSLSATERAARALRDLEAGRTVLLNQTLEVEPDLARLGHRHADLARRYAELRARIDRPVAIGGEAASAEPGQDSSEAAEFDDLVRQIRSVPGFATFADLPSIEELLGDAADGAIVTFNITDIRSDALLLTTDGITALPLPSVSSTSLTLLAIQFHGALELAGSLDVSPAERREAQNTIREALVRLWEDVAEPVLIALGHDSTPGEGDGAWPRVWWATGGLLGLLPLHAAGWHDEAHAGQAVIDRVISSYTPTIRALRYARQKAATAATGQGGSQSRSLIVAMPTTPAAPGRPEPPPLPLAAREAALLAAVLPRPVVLSESQPPTWPAVRDQLRHSTIAHFACHGAFDPTNPSDSHLLLHDHATSPLTVTRLAPLRLDHAQIAYLSACHTAFHADQRLLDESIHLANAFQFAGFPHVIATLWPIYDPIALTVAESFYRYLRLGPDSDPAPDDADFDFSRSAGALHHAIRALRGRPGLRNLPSLWAAYLHPGRELYGA
ncbi:CHAT domain-containing protein [Catenulispora yoronensis]